MDTEALILSKIMANKVKEELSEEIKNMSSGSGSVDINSIKEEIKEECAKKSIYGDTEINVGRKENSIVGELSSTKGFNCVASGRASSAEGQLTTASGSPSHAEGTGTKANGMNSHTEGSYTMANGESSHAEGINTYAYGSYSHAEGGKDSELIASGIEITNISNLITLTLSDSFDGWNNINEWTVAVIRGYPMILEAWDSSKKTITLMAGIPLENGIQIGDTVDLYSGGYNFAVGWLSHVEGFTCIATGNADHAEGNCTKATGNFSHTEGAKSKTTGYASHAEGYSSIASGQYSHTEGYGTKAPGTASHAEGGHTHANGERSHAEGAESWATAFAAHVEGYQNQAAARCAHSEGHFCYATGENAHAENGNTKAKALDSHAEGSSTNAEGKSSHAEGRYSKASGECSHAEGNCTEALDYQHACGHHNNVTTALKCSNSGISEEPGSLFVIGNGTADSKANAFRITEEGVVYSTNSTIQTGADYAEYFEWADGNLENEDRVGHFVTFDNDNPEKIKYANKDDYILGIVSGMPNVIGNGDEEWKKRYILDDFGRYIYENFEYEEKVIEDEKETVITKTGIKKKENPNYNEAMIYVQRARRAEWDAIGMLGVLSIYDDGTCEVNGYCKCGDNGIATKAENKNEGYRVIARLTDNIIKIVFK